MQDNAHAEWVKRQLAAGRVRLEDVSPTVVVETTRTEVLPYNPNRVGFLLVNNNSLSDAHVDYSPDVSTTQGMFLTRSGGSIASRFEEDGQTAWAQLFGVGDTAQVTLYRRSWEVF